MITIAIKIPTQLVLTKIYILYRITNPIKIAIPIVASVKPKPFLFLLYPYLKTQKNAPYNSAFPIPEI